MAACQMAIVGALRQRPVLSLYGLMIISLVALLPLPPLLQDQTYHQFADQRELFGIPNFWNVISNLPFVAVGAVGLWKFHRDATTTVLFAGLFLTGFGSSYYHLDPNDSPLFWDRLPMTLCFAAILAAVVEERVDAKAGAMLLRPMLAIGIFSLLLWRWTDDLPALCLGAVFSLCFIDPDPAAFPAKIYRRILLGRRSGVLCTGQVA
jgi:hypothetical protein